MFPGIIKPTDQTAKTPDDSHIFILFRPIVWLWRKIIWILNWKNHPLLFKVSVVSQERFLNIDLKHTYTLENKNVISLKNPKYYKVSVKPISSVKTPIFKNENFLPIAFFEGANKGDKIRLRVDNKLVELEVGDLPKNQDRKPKPPKLTENTVETQPTKPEKPDSVLTETIKPEIFGPADTETQKPHKEDEDKESKDKDPEQPIAAPLQQAPIQVPSPVLSQLDSDEQIDPLKPTQQTDKAPFVKETDKAPLDIEIHLPPPEVKELPLSPLVKSAPVFLQPAPINVLFPPLNSKPGQNPDPLKAPTQPKGPILKKASLDSFLKHHATKNKPNKSYTNLDMSAPLCPPLPNNMNKGPLNGPGKNPDKPLILQTKSDDIIIAAKNDESIIPLKNKELINKEINQQSKLPAATVADIRLHTMMGGLVGDNEANFPFYLKNFKVNDHPLKLMPKDVFILCEFSEPDAGFKAHFPLPSFYLPVSLFKGMTFGDGLTLKYFDNPLKLIIEDPEPAKTNLGSVLDTFTKKFNNIDIDLFSETKPLDLYPSDNDRFHIYHLETNTDNLSTSHLSKVSHDHLRPLKTPTICSMDILTTDKAGEIILITDMQEIMKEGIDVILTEKALVFYGYNRPRKNTSLKDSYTDSYEEYLTVLDWHKIFPNKKFTEMKEILKGSVFHCINGTLQMNLYLNKTYS